MQARALPKIVYALGLILVLPPASPGLRAQEMSPKAAVELLDGAIQSIRSFDVYVEVTTRSFLEDEVTGQGRELGSAQK